MTASRSARDSSRAVLDCMDVNTTGKMAVSSKAGVGPLGTSAWARRMSLAMVGCDCSVSNVRPMAVEASYGTRKCGMQDKPNKKYLPKQS